MRDVLATEIVVEVFAAELVVEILVALVVRWTFSRYAIGHSDQLPAALTAFSRHRRALAVRAEASAQLRSPPSPAIGVRWRCAPGIVPHG